MRLLFTVLLPFPIKLHMHSFLCMANEGCFRFSSLFVFERFGLSFALPNVCLFFLSHKIEATRPMKANRTSLVVVFVHVVFFDFSNAPFAAGLLISSYLILFHLISSHFVFSSFIFMSIFTFLYLV